MAKTTNNTKTELNLMDRLVLPALFKGKESNFIGIRIVKDIKKKIEITQAEIKKYDLKIGDGVITYNKAGVDAVFRVDFTELERKEIKAALNKMNDDNKLTEEFLDIYEKFIK